MQKMLRDGVGELHGAIAPDLNPSISTHQSSSNTLYTRKIIIYTLTNQIMSFMQIYV